MRNTLLGTFVCAFVLFSGQHLPAQVGSSTDIIGVPSSASSTNTPYSVTIVYTNPAGTVMSRAVSVPNVPATGGWPTPTAAQASAASAAKAAAIVSAINALKIPIMPVTIGGTTYNFLTASVNPKTVAGVYPTGVIKADPVPVQSFFDVFVTLDTPVFASANMSAITVNGTTQAKGFPGSIYRTPGNKATGEIGNGKATFTSATPMGTGSLPPNIATFAGLGATTGMSTGLDASGDPSIVGFGFIDETSSTPVDYIAAFVPPSGLDNEEILTLLANLFDQHYAADGFTASYDPTTDTLSINQPLPAVDFTWSADSDTGLFFDDALVATPEPGSLLLLGTAFACLITALRCRPRWRAAHP